MTTIVPGKVPPPIVVKPNLKGDPGPPGEGVAPGGTIGQILAKVSSTDYDTTWIDSTVVGTDLTYNPATRSLASSTGSDTTLPLVSSAEAGLAPATGGGTTNFLRADGTWAAPTESIIIAVGDETTAITTGNAKVTFRMPYAFTLTAVRASLTTASSSGNPTVDINEGGTSILSTKLSIDSGQKTSTTATTAAVISDSSLADDAEITIDIDTAGTGATGLKVALIGRRA